MDHTDTRKSRDTRIVEAVADRLFNAIMRYREEHKKDPPFMTEKVPARRTTNGHQPVQ